jgi:hypothetical protein
VPIVPPVPDQLPPRAVQWPAVMTYRVLPEIALKPCEQAPPVVLVIACPPMEFHQYGRGASATFSIVTTPAPRFSAHFATPASLPCTDTTSDFEAWSTYQPVTELGRLAAALSSFA